MTNARVAFGLLKGLTQEQMRQGELKPEFQYVGTHMIFDIKLDGRFTRKARLAEVGRNTEPPQSLTYYSVVTRKNVGLSFLNFF